MFAGWLRDGATVHYSMRLLGGVRGAALAPYSNYIGRLA